MGTMTVEGLASTFVAIAVCAAFGRHIAMDKGRSGLFGALVGGMFPIIGLGILLMMERRRDSVSRGVQ